MNKNQFEKNIFDISQEFYLNFLKYHVLFNEFFLI